MHYIVCVLKKGMTKKNILLVKPLPPYLSFNGFLFPLPHNYEYTQAAILETKTRPKQQRQRKQK